MAAGTVKRRARPARPGEKSRIWCLLLRAPQNRASLFAVDSVIQKLTPSLQTPKGEVLAPVPREPRAVRSAAFQRETTLPALFVTRMRCPSKGALVGRFRPLPVSVGGTAPLAARTTEIEEFKLGTQMFVPSKTGNSGLEPTVTVWSTAPAPSSFRRVPGVVSVTQTFAPSKSAP